MLIINRSDHDEHERQDDAMNEQMNSTQRPARRKRPHPARRARRVAGAAGVGGMLLMTGFLAVDGSAAAATNPSNSSLTAIANRSNSTAIATPAAPATVAQSTSKASG